MKHLLVSLFILSSLRCFSQESRTTKLSIVFANCVLNDWETDYRGKLYVYTTQNTLVGTYQQRYKFIKEPIATVETEQIIIKNLKPGNYILKYTNSFKQIFEKTISVTNDSEKQIFLCMDSLNDYPSNTLAKLKLDDSLVVGYEVSGCFYTKSWKIVFENKKNELVSTLFEEVQAPSPSRNPTWNWKIISTNSLKKDEIKAFTYFENAISLAARDENNSTNHDKYIIKSKFGSRIYEDLDWDGFDFLRKRIFPINK